MHTFCCFDFQSQYHPLIQASQILPVVAGNSTVVKAGTLSLA